MESAFERILLRELDESLRVLMTVQSYTIGKYTFDVQKRLLEINGETVQLTRKESYILVYFAANINKLLLRKDILIAIWKEETYYNSRSMDVYICKLRKMLIKDAGIAIINVHGVGYRMLVS